VTMRQFLKKEPALGPEKLRCMTLAFEFASKAVGLTSRDDPLANEIAQKIIEVGKARELDAGSLATLALEELSISRRVDRIREAVLRHPRPPPG
jgi:hypothetical protein